MSSDVSHHHAHCTVHGGSTNFTKLLIYSSLTLFPFNHFCLTAFEDIDKRVNGITI